MIKAGLFLRPTAQAFEQKLVEDSFTAGKSYPVIHNNIEDQCVICDNVGDMWGFLDNKVKMGMFEVLEADDIIEEKIELTRSNPELTKAVLNLRDALDLSTDATVTDLAMLLSNLENV